MVKTESLIQFNQYMFGQEGSMSKQKRAFMTFVGDQLQSSLKFNHFTVGNMDIISLNIEKYDRCLGRLYKKAGFYYQLPIDFIILELRSIQSLYQNFLDKLVENYEIIIDFQQFPNLKIAGSSFEPKISFKFHEKYSIQYQKIAMELINFISSFSEYQEQKFLVFRKEMINYLQDLKNRYEQSCIEHFISMFSFDSSQKYKYRKDIYTQQRFSNAAINRQYLVYNPTSVTKQILKAVKYFISVNNKYRILFLHGPGGIGKSISLSMTIQLYNMVADFSIFSEQYKNNMKMPFQCPKMFYYSFSQYGENRENFNRVISKQLFFQDQVQLLQNSNVSIWNLLQSKYKPEKTIFVFDQINIYYSFIRKYFQGQSRNQYSSNLAQEIDQIKVILTRILSRYRTILSSSENIQINLTNLPCKNASLKFINIRKDYACLDVPIRFEKNTLFQMQKAIIETANMIYFQIQKSTNQYYPNDRQKLETIQRQYQILMNDNICFLALNQFPYICQITHDNVKKFLLDQQKLVMLNQSFPGFESTSETLQSFFIFQFRAIHDENKLQLMKKYKKYIYSGPNYKQNQDKFQQLGQMRQAAQQCMCYDQNRLPGQPISLIFTYRPRSKSRILKFYEFNKQHAVLMDEQIVHYISPKTFLDITDFQLQNFQSLGLFLGQFIHLNSDNRSWFGSTFDKFLVQKISQYANFFPKINLSLQKTKTPNFFLHFTSMGSSNQRKIKSHGSVFVRFMELFDKIDEMGERSKTKYITASPVTQQSNQTLQDPFYSSNSQVIDLLMIKASQEMVFPSTQIKTFQQQSFEFFDDSKLGKKNNFSYDLITIDFATSFQIKKLQEKIINAKKFFKNFNQIVNLQQKRANRPDIQRMKDKVKISYYKYQKNRKFHLRTIHQYSFLTRLHLIVVPKYIQSRYLQQIQKEKVQSLGKDIILMALQELGQRMECKMSQLFRNIEHHLYKELEAITERAEKRTNKQ